MDRIANLQSKKETKGTRQPTEQEELQEEQKMPKRNRKGHRTRR